MGTIRLILLTLLSVATLFLAGCKDEGKEYRRGYEDGAKAAEQQAYRKGQEDGYAAGFERARPGSASTLSGAGRVFYQVLIWGGAIKILGALLFAALHLFKESDSVEQTVGKILYSILGAVIGVAGIIYLKASDEVVSLFLLSSPRSLPLQAGIFVIAAFFTVGFFSGLRSITEAKNLGVHMESWLLAFVSSVLTVSAPVFEYLIVSVPDITAYLASNLFLGAMFGGLLWLANRFLEIKREVPTVETTSAKKR